MPQSLSVADMPHDLKGACHVLPFHPEQLVIAPDPVACAVRDVHLSVADFAIAVQQATTIDECLRLRRQIASLVICLSAVESAAMDKAEAF